jgi:hypothetical protein
MKWKSNRCSEKKDKHHPSVICFWSHISRLNNVFLKEKGHDQSLIVLLVAHLCSA